ncbi:MAG: SGNH/GDSL hydrolase family protein [Chloracidobacterium sp.]|nr:SGNH/GDSL hydrolase family protein [Chloracidobacterium sp.]
MIFLERLRSFPRRGFIGIVFAVAVLAVITPSASTDTDGWQGRHQIDRSWIASWAASPEAPFPTGLSMTGFTDQTLRQIVFNSLGGDVIRVRFTNEFSDRPLNIGAAQVAIAAPNGAIEAGSERALTFGGQSSITIVPNAQVASDPVRLQVSATGELALDIYLPGSTGPVTWHRVGLRTTYISSVGNHVGEPLLPILSTTPSYFFLKSVEVRAARRTGVVVAFGDSITDGQGSTLDANNSYPNQLGRLLAASKEDLKMAAVNQGIAGNQATANSIGGGQNVQARFDRDVLSQPGVTHVIVLIGLNDTFFTGGLATDQVIAGLKQLILRAHAKGVKVYGGTLTPVRMTGNIEAARQAINEWIRASGKYDAVIDFDAAIRDPNNPTAILPAYNIGSGDNIHPNDAGYEAMAQAAYEVLRRDLD